LSDKIAFYLQQHLSGEVMTARDAIDHFSSDGSIFSLRPRVVVYPRSSGDVRKVAKFTWQLAEKGYIFPITARGRGTDQSGAALGEGILLIFPAHMNKILELDRDSVIVQPGLNYSKLEQALHTHYRFLPPYPSSIEFSSIGGAIANNAAGEKSVKYGDTRSHVLNLNVILANGEMIQTQRLNKRELNKKKGLTTMEGEIYRTLDGLLSDNQKLLTKMDGLNVRRNTAGYAINLVKDSKGSFDLTPLFVGSQGTLGVITQATLRTENFNPRTSLLIGFFDDLERFDKALAEIRKLAPSAMEFVDQNLLEVVQKNNPARLQKTLPTTMPRYTLLVEFDDVSEATQHKKAKKAKKILKELASDYKSAYDEADKEEYWKVRHSAAEIIWQNRGVARALPFVDDAIVPLDKFAEFIKAVYQLFERHQVELALWGHAGEANLHLQPLMDLSSVGDRQRILKLSEDFYQLVTSLGGSTSASRGDGRIRGAFLPQVYGPEIYDLFVRVKKIFDPHGTLNPGVKTEVDLKDLMRLMRKEHTLGHLFDHMPRS
jgi:FAD/FMN-containing dehydrogenase